MVWSQFGLRHDPFADTAETVGYYPATTHEWAWKQLTDAIDNGDGFALLAAGPGLGKSMILFRLLERYSPIRATVWLSNGHLANPSALFQALLFDLGRSFESTDEQRLRLEVTQTLVEGFQKRRATLLLMDEAHLLPDMVLEELRMLGNLESRHGKALQVILAGQPRLLERLQGEPMECLSHRIRNRVLLEPMNIHEGADYIVHRLRAAGGPEGLFIGEAVQMLAQAGKGNPRRLNQVSKLALEVARAADCNCIDAEVVTEALRWFENDSHESSITQSWRFQDATMTGCESTVSNGTEPLTSHESKVAHSA